MANLHPIDLASMPVGCQHCHLQPFCDYASTRKEKRILGTLRFKICKFERGDYLFRENNTHNTIYVIRSGSVKTYNYVEDGQEQVTGFHLGGKLLGMDAIGHGHHTQSAVCLETCSICEIPYARLEHISKQYPQLQNMLLYAMSSEIRDDHYQLALLSRKSAAARLSSFLLSLSRNFHQRGYSASNFYLSLSRHDIANLLGLAVETVSRLFTQFQQDGLVSVDRKHVLLTNIEGLERISAGEEEVTRIQTRYHLTQRVNHPVYPD